MLIVKLTNISIGIDEDQSHIDNPHGNYICGGCITAL